MGRPHQLAEFAVTKEDIATVTALVKGAGTSFYYGMKILPALRRDAMYGVYAFCRVVDDIADDDDVPFAEKRAALQKWRERIAAAYKGQADDAVTRVLAAIIPLYELKEKDFIAVIDGMEMDAGVPIVAPPMPVLDLYCDRVAAAVGRLSVRIFGDASNAAEDVAYALGRALQLTNILRDVAEDAARGRLYLPHEYLAEAEIGFTPEAALAAPALPQVCEKLARLAEKYFAQAESAMGNCDAKAMRPARLMAASYKPLLGLLRRAQYNYQGPRISLPRWQKLALAARVFL
jgi:phytoene synthase